MSDAATKASWNLATANHNAHKGDQAAFFRAGGDVLFPEELELLGPLAGRDLVHLQCNSGQDSLGLARRGAHVTAVDFAEQAIAFAVQLAADTGIEVQFCCAEVVAWLEDTPKRFDLAFTSYGTTGWLPDIQAWARGVARVLRPGGALVYVEFHPLVWSLDGSFALRGDNYFANSPFVAPVGDYVAESGPALGASLHSTPQDNPLPATSYQWGLGNLLSALADAGLVLEVVREYPWANGCKVVSGLVAGPDRRWVFPPDIAPVPLMVGIRCRKPM